jgi:hypothetical protein
VAKRWLLHSSLRSLEALDVFYRGLSRFYAGTKDDNAAAREAFETLARLQPDSAVGPAYLCFTHWVDAFRGWTDTKERALAEAAGDTLERPLRLPQRLLQDQAVFRHGRAAVACGADAQFSHQRIIQSMHTQNAHPRCSDSFVSLM